MTEKKGGWGLILAPHPHPYFIPPPSFHNFTVLKWIWQHGVNKDYPQSYLYVITFIHSRDQKKPVASRAKFREISCGREAANEIAPL